jgi:uncharacterized membrane protein
MAILVVLLCLLIIATPILAILAFVRVQRLAQQLQAARLQDLIARVYSLEQQLSQLAKSVQTLGGSQAGPPSESAAPAQRVGLPPTPTHTAPSAPASPLPCVSSTVPPPPGVRKPMPAANLNDTPSSEPATRAKVALTDLEGLIAGRWLNRIGILALIVAVSFFLKYAFDNNWIGPSGRVGIGILSGAAMLPWSHWLLGKGYSYFSEGIAALGQATLLLSVWAGCRYYSLFNTDAGLAGMVVITVVMAAIALGRDSQRIALLSLLGGFLTPILLSSGRDEQVALFTYLLILGGGLLIIGARRDWQLLAPFAFFFTQIYFWGWYASFYQPAKLERTIIFATLIFLLYCALPVLRTVRFSSLDEVGLFIVPLNSLAYLGAAYAMLWPEYRGPLTLLVLALSAGHIVLARLVPPPKPGEWPVTRQLFAGLALTFVTVAIPIRLDGKWITLALALEGAIVIRIGYRALMPALRGAGFLLLAIAALRVVVLPLPAQPALFNERFGTYVGVIVSMGIALFAARQHIAATNQPQTGTVGLLGVAINLDALLALSLEFWDYFGQTTSRSLATGFAQHLALSLLWTVYASILILVGMKRQSPPLRWQALVLFGLVVIKVFVYDSSYLERFYRILSFFVLGLVLLIVSFLYQSKTSRERTSL